VEKTSHVLPDFYAARAEQHRQACHRLERKSRLLSNLRGVTFATWIVAWGFALFGSAGAFAVVLGSVACAAFVVFVLVHARIVAAESLETRWVSANEDATARVSRDAWHELPTTGEQFRDPSHPYADDLDLFGRASLFQRLCVAKTHLGQARLAQYLLQPALPAEILARQAMIAALAPLLDLRQKLEVLARATLGTSKPAQTVADLEPLFAWGEAPADTSSRPRLARLSRLLPLITTLVLALCYWRVIPAWIGLLPLAGHLSILVLTRQATAQLVRVLLTTEQTVLKVEPLFELLENEPPDGVLRHTFDRELKSPATRPSSACRSLRRIAGWFEFRHNGLLYPFVNLYLLWDLQCAVAFDAWRTQHGKRLRTWFAVLGEAEALSSLAGFYHDEPQACFAQVTAGEATFEAEALGHPLLSIEQRVNNDVYRLEAGQGLLVTGSNMSGKSTFLRAIGLGAVLGLAGGPVCAKRLRLSPLSVATSMRIADSLAGGVSHFYAELRKLRAVLAATQASRPVLFLLDEILHGTNSRERHIGARWILSKLVTSNALGAVSTHDLALCALSDDLADRLRLVHFRENVVQEQMTFDYLLRDGPVTSGNALRLMRSLGLEVPLEGE
jgi:hypothetical protein